MRTPESNIVVYRFEHQKLVQLMIELQDWIFDNGDLIVYDIVFHMDTPTTPFCTALVYVMAP